MYKHLSLKCCKAYLNASLAGFKVWVAVLCSNKRLHIRSLSARLNYAHYYLLLLLGLSLLFPFDKVNVQLVAADLGKASDGVSMDFSDDETKAC